MKKSPPIKPAARAETIRVDVHGTEYSDQVVAHAAVGAEHEGLVSRFQWYLQDGKVIANINGFDVELSTLLRRPNLALPIPTDQ
jgi:hypothetical protein